MTACFTCTTGTSPKGSTYCEDCPAGAQLNGTKNKCEDCPSGTVSAAGQPCQSCTVGNYANEEQTDCDACEAGRWGAIDGLWNDTCTGSCAPGTYSYRAMTSCLTCEGGKFSNKTGSDRCDVCNDLDGFTSLPGATACSCVVGKYLSDQGTCVPCKEGMECAELGSEAQSLNLTAGFYRPSLATVEVVECPVKAACIGGLGVAANNSCRAGNEGVLCAVCTAGYYQPSAFVPCEECGDKTLAIVSALGALLGMVVSLGGFILINRRAPSGLLRPFINLVQQLSVMLASVHVVGDGASVSL